MNLPQQHKTEIAPGWEWLVSLNSYSLVVAEKPDAAKKLAIALGWKKTQNEESATIFEIPSGFD